MELFTPEEKKVEIATFKAGYDWQKEDVKKYLKKDTHYTVLRTEVGGFSSKVYLKEFPEIGFNTVFFKNVDHVSQEEIKNHPDQIKFNPR